MSQLVQVECNKLALIFRHILGEESLPEIPWETAHLLCLLGGWTLILKFRTCRRGDRGLSLYDWLQFRCVRPLVQISSRPSCSNL